MVSNEEVRKRCQQKTLQQFFSAIIALDGLVMSKECKKTDLQGKHQVVAIRNRGEDMDCPQHMENWLGRRVRQGD